LPEAFPQKNSRRPKFSRHVSAGFRHISTAEAFSIFSDRFAGPAALTSGVSPAIKVTTLRRVDGVVCAKATYRGMGFTQNETEFGKNLSCQENRHVYKQQNIEQVSYQRKQVASFQNALA
jgi:hypothetical protein